MKWLWRLTGGRPMRYSEHWFFDHIFWEPVDLYEDRLGRFWMARNAWAPFFRIRINVK